MTQKRDPYIKMFSTLSIG